jgi:hypothetical protein
MGNLKNAALFWCKIKGYIMLFLAFIFGLLFITGLFSKDQKDKKQRLTVSGIFTIVLIIMYYVLKTDIGCGVSIAGDAYNLLK